MNTPFNARINLDNEFVHRVVISGELRRGTQLSGVDWQQVIATAKSAADKKKVIFDLLDLSYWDTAGMADIIGAVVAINKANKGTTKRAAIIKPKIEHLFKLTNILDFARRKFPDFQINEDDIPILKSESEVETFVEG